MKTKFKFFAVAAFFSVLTTGVFSQVQNASCPTDVNADGITSSGDASLVAAQVGTTCPGGGAPCPTDINHSGATTNSDLSLVLLKIGVRCDVGVFDVSNAVYGSGYVDVPFYISSPDSVISLDYALKFNETKLTYSAINTLASYPNFSPLAYFNPDDRTLRMTSFTTTKLDNDVQLISIRFTIGTGVTITQSDFTVVRVLLNGNPKGYIVR